jgi:hypothetical protein
VENSEANDGCLEEKKMASNWWQRSLRVIAAVTNPAKKRLLLPKYSGPSSS